MEPKKNLVVVLLKTDHSINCSFWFWTVLPCFLNIFALQRWFFKPIWRQGPPIGCWSGLRCAAPPTSAAPKWVRSQPLEPSQPAMDTMDTDLFNDGPKKNGPKIGGVFRVSWFFLVSNDFRNWLELILWWFQVGIQKSRHRWSSWRSPGWSGLGFLVVPWEVSEGSLVEVQEMNNVEIQGGWSAPQQQRCWKHLETLLRYLVVI